MQLCEAVQKWLSAIICKIDSSGTKVRRRDGRPAAESKLSLCWLARNHEKACTGQVMLFTPRVKTEEGRQGWAILSFGKEAKTSLIWGLRFLICPEKTKRHDKSPLEEDYLTIWCSSGGRVKGRSQQEVSFWDPEPWWPGSGAPVEKHIRLLSTAKAWLMTNIERKEDWAEGLHSRPNGTWHKPLQLPDSVSSPVNQTNELLRSLSIPQFDPAENNTRH